MSKISPVSAPCMCGLVTKDCCDRCGETVCAQCSSLSDHDNLLCSECTAQDAGYELTDLFDRLKAGEVHG